MTTPRKTREPGPKSGFAGHVSKEPGQWGPGSPSSAPPFSPARRRVLSLKGARIAAGALLVAALALITWQSLVPPTGMGGFPMQDKVLHFLAYAGVAGLCVVVAGAVAKRKVWAAAVFSMVWGLGVEIAQTLMALGRDGSWGDMVANGMGAVAGAAIIAWLMRR